MLANQVDKNKQRRKKAEEKGFTLIELSIVLVIIGLIVGGVLVGQDLIRAAEIRATVSQIEKYNTAVNTFRSKYNALPGDINSATASQFGFASRGTIPGQGDGNGIIEGWSGTAANGMLQDGETLSFWSDLSVGNAATPLNINLVDGSFTTYSLPTQAAPSITSTTVSYYMPQAKFGRGNYVYVYSTNGVNYYGILPITTSSGAITPPSSFGMTVNQAYQIDKKVDDGYPVSGNVQANYAGTAENGTIGYPQTATVGNGNATTCYESTNASTAPGQYSVEVNNGNGPNCTLSFRFQ